MNTADRLRSPIDGFAALNRRGRGDGHLDANLRTLLTEITVETTGRLLKRWERDGKIHQM